MSIIVGLGNIGQEYDGTRHNIGFEVVEAIAETLSITFGPGDGPFVVAEGRHRGRNVILIKPTTYMNRSGLAVRKALATYKSDKDHCLIVYDDLNLDVGDVRLKATGSAGGHNGIQNIIDLLGSRDFPRLRFGIGNDFPRGKQVDFVLSPFKKGQRVGVGWHGGHCFECEPCRRGDFINCQNAEITGISFDGGYQEYMAAPKEALALVPEELKSADAAPLLCAGVTVFNALRNTNAKAGDLVAIQGIGGLGHLGIQYAKKMGFKTVAISGTKSKEKLALELGADHFLSASDDNVLEELQKMGGAKVILATAPSSKAVSEVFDGLGPNGSVVAVGADMQPVEIGTMQLISGKKTLTGHASGTAMDSEDTLNFSALSDSTPMIETYPLEKAAEAYDRMISNEARFRTVLVMDQG